MRDMEFDDIINQAKRIVGESKTIAETVYPNGALLQCAKCGHTANATQAQVSRYFSTGWPMHCNTTMGARSL